MKSNDGTENPQEEKEAPKKQAEQETKPESKPESKQAQEEKDKIILVSSDGKEFKLATKLAKTVPYVRVLLDSDKTLTNPEITKPEDAKIIMKMMHSSGLEAFIKWLEKHKDDTVDDIPKPFDLNVCICC